MSQSSLQQISDSIISDATQLQNKASNPQFNIWVNASAGTGKTKVLTDRVLRLLLPIEGENDGVNPQNIICITFTKAGANEMITRVMDILSDWAVCSEQKLYEALEKLLGHSPTLQQKDKARKLFAIVIDTPGGLNITTIHAFCQSILGRFTIEANLPPNFKVIEESEAKNLLKQARDNLIISILADNSECDLRDAFSWLSAHYNGEQIQKILASFIAQKKIIEVIDVHTYTDYLRETLFLHPNDNFESVYENFISDSVYPTHNIKQIASALLKGTKTQIEDGEFLNKFIQSSFEKRTKLYDEYYSIFFTDKNTLRNFPKPLIKLYPDVEGLFFDEAERVEKFNSLLAGLKIYEASKYMLVIARDIIARYQDLKLQKRGVDYDDLIDKTQELLSGSMRDWVLYKLDFNIDHILVDEAQDTSPQQWDIILAILDEFYSGMTNKNEKINRTMFVVGDTKQSIFSFQGANPTVYNSTKTKIEKLVLGAGKQYFNIPMNTSFRSMPAVLGVVDSVFSEPQMKLSLTQNPEEYGNHLTKWHGYSGVVECWPLYKTETSDDKTAWILPIKIVENLDSMAILAKRIALSIKQMIDSKEIIQSKGRPVTAGDIMILVRRRNAMVEHLIRALKSNNIPVSGADRLVITNHIAVQDIIAALEFVLLPEDDLNLAVLLKSPLIGMDDAQLEDIAYGRKGSLWKSLQENGNKKLQDYLSDFISALSGKNAFSAISYILNKKSCIDGYTGWQSFVSRLGHDCLDPLEEFLSIAQSYDANTPGGGLQGFIHTIQTNSSEIKRELEQSGGMVRIMTVHASKGLQAPIVICPDSTSLPKSSGQSGQSFLWVEDNLPMWVPSKINHEIINRHREILDQKIYDEYNRLLYVAMTRAEDRLIICGTLNKKQKNIPEKSWYNSVSKALVEVGAVQSNWNYDTDFIAQECNSDYLKFETEQINKVENKISNEIGRIKPPIPDWLISDLPKESFPPKILKPSKGDDEDVPVRSPLTQSNDKNRFRRGLLTHSLLQYLPNITMDKREAVGKNYLKKQASELSEAIRVSILNEVLAILTHPDFAPYFGEGSLAEVPLTGKVTNTQGKIEIISGQIDRMLVTDNSVWIVDFKSNRPPPKNIKDIPTQYRNQLKAYKTLIKDIYPNHTIHCALLWTDGPFMSELKDL